MSESRWIVVEMGGGLLAAFEWRYVLSVLPAPERRPLPRAKPWTAGWIVHREEMIPVLSGRDWCSAEEGSILIVLEYAGRKIACPVVRADWWQGRYSEGGEAARKAPGPPASAVVADGPWSGARCVDVPALYRSLGIQ